MRLIDLFDRGVAISPDRVCLKDDRTSLSFSEVKARSCRFANAIAAAGYSPGQKAAIYSPNCVEGFGTAWQLPMIVLGTAVGGVLRYLLMKWWLARRAYMAA